MEATATTNAPPTKWAIFPCHPIVDGKCSCPNPDCTSPGKHPRTPNGLKDATADKTRQAEWWRQNPDANLAIPTGHINRILVVDIDADKGGFETLLEIEEEYGQFPDTLTARTGGGGLHHYFALPDTETIGSRNGWRKGIDIKCEGGYL